MKVIELAPAITPAQPAIEATTPCVKIDKGVPMPSNLGRRGWASKYPWHAMEVGDSIAVPIPTDAKTRIRARAKMAWYACAYGKRQGKKFAGKTCVEGDVLVYRVWRIT